MALNPHRPASIMPVECRPAIGCCRFLSGFPGILLLWLAGRVMTRRCPGVSSSLLRQFLEIHLTPNFITTRRVSFLNIGNIMKPIKVTREAETGRRRRPGTPYPRDISSPGSTSAAQTVDCDATTVLREQLSPPRWSPPPNLDTRPTVAEMQREITRIRGEQVRPNF